MIGNPHESRNFNSHTIEASNSPSCRNNRATQNKTYKLDVHNTDANMPDYFRASTNRTACKKASEILTNEIHNEFSDVFQALAAMKVHSVYR